MIYRDDIQYQYAEKYPILELSNEYFTQDDIKKILKKLKKTPWYKYTTKESKKEAINKLKSIIFLAGEIVSIFKKIYPQLDIKHISIGGSYLFKEDATNDIDFNIIVDGSFFGYTDYFDIENINKKLIIPVRKISFMVFGEQDFLKNTGVYDQIHTSDYVHTDLLMREGVVFPIRNIFVYGFDIKNQKIDKSNLLIRLKRQLYQADLILNSLIGKYSDENIKNKKVLGRVFEAVFYLSIVFKKLKIKPKDVILNEKYFDIDCINNIKNLIKKTNETIDNIIV